MPFANIVSFVTFFKCEIEAGLQCCQLTLNTVYDAFAAGWFSWSHSLAGGINSSAAAVRHARRMICSLALT